MEIVIELNFLTRVSLHPLPMGCENLMHVQIQIPQKKN